MSSNTPLWKTAGENLRVELIELAKVHKYPTPKETKGKPKAFITPIDMLDAIMSYFEYTDDNPVTSEDYVGKDATRVERRYNTPYIWEGLCLYLGKNTRYFSEFEQRIRDGEVDYGNDYSAVITYARNIIYQKKITGATIGIYSHHIVARDLGLADKKQLEGGERPITLLGGDSVKANDSTGEDTPAKK